MLSIPFYKHINNSLKMLIILAKEVKKFRQFWGYEYVQN